MSTQTDYVNAILAPSGDENKISYGNVGAFQQVVISDTNVLQYQTSVINFNSESLLGMNGNRSLDLANALVQIPITTCVSLSAGSFGSPDSGANWVLTPADARTHALNPLMCIENIQLQVGGKNVHSMVDNFPMFVCQKLQEMNKGQREHCLALFGMDQDSYESILLNATVGEMNNRLWASRIGGPAGQANEGLFKRCQHQRVQGWTYQDERVMSGNAAFENKEYSGLIGVFASDQTAVAKNASGVYSSVTAKLIQTLVYQHVLNFPLWLISDFFKHVRPLQTLSKFVLRIRTNITPNNVWTATLPAPVATTLTIPTAITGANEGSCCPFMMCSPSGRPIDAVDPELRTAWRHSAAGIVSFTGAIGYRSVVGFPVGGRILSTDMPSGPCRILCSSITMTEELFRMHASNSRQEICYTDYSVDVSNTLLPGTSRSVVISNQNQYLTKLTIIPVLSSGASRPNAMQSLLSSCPATPSPCNLSNIQIQIAGAQVFAQPLNSYLELFQRGVLMTKNAGSTSGGDYGSMTSVFSGQNYDEFRACPILEFDLSCVPNAGEHAEVKSIQISLTNRGSETVDLYFMLTRQEVVSIDLLSSQVIPVM